MKKGLFHFGSKDAGFDVSLQRSVVVAVVRKVGGSWHHFGVMRLKEDAEEQVCRQSAGEMKDRHGL